MRGPGAGRQQRHGLLQPMMQHVQPVLERLVVPAPASIDQLGPALAAPPRTDAAAAARLPALPCPLRCCSNWDRMAQGKNKRAFLQHALQRCWFPLARQACPLLQHVLDDAGRVVLTPPPPLP